MQILHPSPGPSKSTRKRLPIPVVIGRIAARSAKRRMSWPHTVSTGGSVRSSAPSRADPRARHRWPACMKNDFRTARRRPCTLPCSTTAATIARSAPCIGSWRRRERPASAATNSLIPETSCWPQFPISSGVGTSPSLSGVNYFFRPAPGSLIVAEHKLLGPAKWTYFHLYVILDVFSR